MRVWLEPGYDHGRWGAWLLDWPGCFTWGSSRHATLARVHSAAWRFADWLAAHGEPRPEVPHARPEVVEEVAPTVVGGYERNATFRDDWRQVSADELERNLRWLDHAHRDLVAAIARVRAFEAAGGRLAPEDRDPVAVADGADQGREVRHVIRHVAGAETWLTSRLDRTLRFVGVDAAADPDADVATTHAWSMDRLRELWARDPALSGEDGKGESWTLAKVLRRQIYHLLDHADELDRRLCFAERRLDRVRVEVDGPVPAGPLHDLAVAGGLGGSRLLSLERIDQALANTQRRVAAWEGDRLVGFARIVGDGVAVGYVSFVVIHPSWQDRGLGSVVMETLLDGRPEDKLILEARTGTEPFYERFGFEPITWAMVRRRVPSGR